jgi:hypothetical protein
VSAAGSWSDCGNEACATALGGNMTAVQLGAIVWAFVGNGRGLSGAVRGVGVGDLRDDSDWAASCG